MAVSPNIPSLSLSVPPDSKTSLQPSLSLSKSNVSKIPSLSLSKVPLPSLVSKIPSLSSSKSQISLTPSPSLSGFPEAIASQGSGIAPSTITLSVKSSPVVVGSI